jgi:O-antigen/teichoic acid export membrane protein
VNNPPTTPNRAPRDAERDDSRVPVTWRLPPKGSQNHPTTRDFPAANDVAAPSNRSRRDRPQPPIGNESGATLASDTAIRVVTDVVTLLCALASFILLTRAFGTGPYGVYLGLYSVLNPLTPLAFSGAIAALFESVMRDEMPLQRARSRTAGICLISSTAALPVSLLAAHFIVQAASLTSVAIYVVADLILLGQQATALTTVRVSKGVRPASILGLVSPIAKVGVYAATLYLGWSFDDMALPYLAVGVVVTLYLFAITARMTRTHASPQWPERHRWGRSGNYSAAQVGWSFQDSGDKMALSYFNDASLGPYGAAYRICSFAFIPLGALDQATNHLFVSKERTGQPSHLHRARRLTVAAVAYSLLFVVGAFMTAPLLPKILGPKWEDSVSMFRWLSLLVPFRAVGIFPSSALVGVGKLHQRTKAMLVNSVFTVVIYIVLVKRYSWHGGVLGTVISEATLSVMLWFLLMKAKRSAALPPNLVSSPA